MEPAHCLEAGTLVDRSVPTLVWQDGALAGQVRLEEARVDKFWLDAGLDCQGGGGAGGLAHRDAVLDPVVVVAGFRIRGEAAARHEKIVDAPRQERAIGDGGEGKLSGNGLAEP